MEGLTPQAQRTPLTRRCLTEIPQQFNPSPTEQLPGSITPLTLRVNSYYSWNRNHQKRLFK